MTPNHLRRGLAAAATALALLAATGGWTVLPARAMLAATAGWTVLPAQAGITFRTLE